MGRTQPETVTVLFTDVVASTAWRARVGEQRADAGMVGLLEVTGEVVRDHGGTVVKGLGDGVMATFPSAASAIEAASSLRMVAKRLSFTGDVGVRIGISTGDMVRDGADWSGAAAIEASRLCGECGAGDVLVAEASVLLCRGRPSQQLRPLG